MMERYVMVAWPKVQSFMSHKRWKDCIACYPTKDHPCPDCAYMVPEDVYLEVMG